MFFKKRKQEILRIYSRINQLQIDLEKKLADGQRISEEINALLQEHEQKWKETKDIEERRTKIINDHENGIKMCIEGINEDRLAIQKIVKKLSEKSTKTTKRR